MNPSQNIVRCRIRITHPQFVSGCCERCTVARVIHDIMAIRMSMSSRVKRKIRAERWHMHAWVMCKSVWVGACKQTHILRVRTINKQSIINKQWILATTRSWRKTERKVLWHFWYYTRILHAVYRRLRRRRQRWRCCCGAGVGGWLCVCVSVSYVLMLFACTHKTQSLHGKNEYHCLNGRLLHLRNIKWTLIRARARSLARSPAWCWPEPHIWHINTFCDVFKHALNALNALSHCNVIRKYCLVCLFVGWNITERARAPIWHINGPPKVSAEICASASLSFSVYIDGSPQAAEMTCEK